MPIQIIWEVLSGLGVGVPCRSLIDNVRNCSANVTPSPGFMSIEILSKCHLDIIFAHLSRLLLNYTLPELDPFAHSQTLMQCICN